MHSFHSRCDVTHHNYGTDQFFASQFVLSYDNQYKMCVLPLIHVITLNGLLS